MNRKYSFLKDTIAFMLRNQIFESSLGVVREHQDIPMEDIGTAIAVETFLEVSGTRGVAEYIRVLQDLVGYRMWCGEEAKALLEEYADVVESEAG